MPGIIGIVSEEPSEEYYALLESMVKCLVHEPFYTSGTYINEELGIWSGWACHEGAFGDCLPIWNEKKDICLIFSGEDFADQICVVWARFCVARPFWKTGAFSRESPCFREVRRGCSPGANL